MSHQTESAAGTADLSATRLQALQAKLAVAEVDALLVSDEINVRYLSGFTGDSSYLLVQSGGPTWILSDRRYETQIAAECPDLTAAIRPPTQPMEELTADVLGQIFGQASSRRIGIESEHVTLAAFEHWQKQTKTWGVPVDWQPRTGLVELLRVIKDADEVQTIRESIDIAQRAYLSVIHRLTPKMTERQIAHDLENVMRSLGASGVSFEPIVGVQPAGALPHYRPGDIPLADTPTLLIDWGASFRGYASDLTRTLHQDTASDRFGQCYAAVLEAQLAAIDAIRGGVNARQVDAVARASLKAAGLGDAFKHGLGHGIGLQIHESPRLSPSIDAVLQPGMVVTVEPGVYFENEFGIRIEDDVLVTQTGCEVLSSLPKGLDDCRLIL